MATIMRNYYPRVQQGKKVVRMAIVSRKQLETKKASASGLLMEGSDADPTHQDGERAGLITSAISHCRALILHASLVLQSHRPPSEGNS
jgi:hypothetical protein